MSAKSLQMRPEYPEPCRARFPKERSITHVEHRLYN